MNMKASWATESDEYAGTLQTTIPRSLQVSSLSYHVRADRAYKFYGRTSIEKLARYGRPAAQYGIGALAP